MSRRTTRGTTTSARVAVDNTSDLGVPAAAASARSTRPSLVYQSAVGTGGEGNQPLPQSQRRHPHGHRLSLEDQLKIRKTSALLTNANLHALVRSQRETTRLDKFKAKCLHLYRRPLSDGKDRIAETVVGVSPHAASHVAPWRQWLRVHIKTSRFRTLLYSVVMLDVVALAMDERMGDEITSFTWLDVGCTLLLFLEVVLKSLAFGWFTGPSAYFGRSKRVVRILNLALLALSLLSYAFGHPWRILRGLKTVRCLTLYGGLRRILRSLARAIPFLANVGTLALFFLFAFSIFGLEAYKGAFRHQCAIASNDQIWLAVPTQYCATNASCLPPLACGRVSPSSAHVNFDSGLSSLFLVFLVVAQDGWVSDIMQPIVEATSGFSALFFVAIVASMVFLVVNLFVAVITTSFMNFSVETSPTKSDAHKDDDDDDETTRRTRGSMIKMDPLEEATRVSLIMGATLAIEESIQQQQQQQQPIDEGVNGIGGDHRKRSKITTLLARTHRFHSLHDFTVDATLELLQNASPVDDFLLARSSGAAKASALPASPANGEDEEEREEAMQGGDPLAGEGETVPAPSTRRSLALSTWSLSRSPRRQTAKFLVHHAPFSSLADVLHHATDPSDSTSTWFATFQRTVLSKRFDDCITICIVVNTAFLLIEYRGMPAWITVLLSISEYLFGAIFLCEMLVRIVAMRGLRRYLRSTERFFDLIVVLCTTINIVLNNLPDANFSGLNSVSSLRTLRVSRLMLKWDGTRKLIESVVKSSRGVLDVVAFLILFQVVNSIWAMQLFGGGHLTRDGNVPRWNFDTFPRAFLTLLQVITADQWASITYDAVDADDPHSLLVPFLILNFIIGQYVLLNLFIAVILENFSISEEEAYQLQLEQIIAIPKELDIYEKIEEQGVRAFGEMEQLDNVSNVKLRMFLGLDATGKQGTRSGATGGSSGESGRSGDLHGPRAGRPLQRLFADRVLARGRALSQRVATSRAFHRVVQLMILVSCVTLMLDDPHPEILTHSPSEDRLLALSVCNRVALGIFLIDFIAKIGAHGFGWEFLTVQLIRRDEALGYVKKQAYMEDKWNQLDCFLLTLTLADEFIAHFSDSSVSLTRVFRAGRVLRPLRILNHHHEMKLILSAVAQSLPHVGNVFGLCAIVYIIFGVVGRSLFSGLFFSCNDPAIPTMDECVGFFTSDDFLVPRVWQNARFSFDNIGAAFLTLLEMTSLKWIDKTFLAMDITGRNQQPLANQSPLNALFFVLYVYVGALFVIRLFVGVLVEQFQRNNGTQILTESQKSWVDLEKFVLLLKPLTHIPRPSTRSQNMLYDLCQHRYFGRTIAVAILLNVALLLFNPSKNTSQNDVDLAAQSTSFEVIEMLFLAIFLTEAALKIVAFRQYYVLSSTGAFELLILGGSLAAYSLATGIHGLIQAGRVFRMMRVLRFVRLNRGVYAVFQTFRASLKPIGHIFFLLFMIFFIFAVVGRQLFGGVRLGDSMNRFSNFRSFRSSFLLLFQIMAGDDWHLTMTDCMVSTPFCVERNNPVTGKNESDCGSPVAAVLFFVTYITLVVFFLLNLFIAVVLENFRSCYLQDDVCPISLQDFETYKQVFLTFDVGNDGAFPLWQLGAFLHALPPGLRVDKTQHRAAFLQLRSQTQALLESWQQQRCKRPFFNELLRALCIHQLGIRCLPYEQQRDRVKQIFIYRAKVAEMLVEATMKGYVQRWRRRNERDKLEKLRRKMVPEVAVLGSRDKDRAADRETSGVPEEAATTEAEEEEETSSLVQQQVGGLVRAEPEGIMEEGPKETLENAGIQPDSSDPPSHARHHHRHHHHRHHKHHKKKHGHGPTDSHTDVTPVATDKEEEETSHGEDLPDTSVDPSPLVPKMETQPLYAPRRLPKMTHKVVPTG